MQSLCTLRGHCRQWPRNTRYQAGATLYLGRTCTGWIAPACGWRTHSITSSAATSNLSDTARPSILAVEALMTSSNVVACTTGNSAGFAPRLASFQGSRRPRADDLTLVLVTAAKICTVSLFACGLSTATNSTPESHQG